MTVSKSLRPWLQRDINKIVALYEGGVKIRVIAEQVDRSSDTVSTMLSRLRRMGVIGPKRRAGNKRMWSVDNIRAGAADEAVQEAGEQRACA